MENSRITSVIKRKYENDEDFRKYVDSYAQGRNKKPEEVFDHMQVRIVHDAYCSK